VRVQGVFTRFSLGLLLLLASPTWALAAGGSRGPSRREWVTLGAVALAATVLVFFLYRLIYRALLLWDWRIDIAIFSAIAVLLLAWAAIWLFFYLWLWPQAWARIAWMVVAALAVVVLLISLVGRTQRA